MDVWKIQQVLKARKWTVIITALVACVLILLTGDTSQDIPRYRSTAELLFNTERVSVDGEATGNSAGWLGDVVILKELMLSQDFLEKHVVPNLKGKNWVDLRDAIDMKSLNSGNGAVLAQVSADDNDPKESQLIAQTVADSLCQYIPELMTREYEGNRQFIEKLVGEAKGQLDDAESSIVDWQQKHHVLTATDDYQEQMKTIAQLTEERAMLADREAAAQARFDMLSHYKPGDTAPFAVQSSGDGKTSNLGMLQQSLAEARMKLEQMRGTLKSDQPTLANQQQEVARLQAEVNRATSGDIQSMRKDAETEINEARSQTASLDKSLHAMQSGLQVGPENLDFARRQRAIELWDKNYQELVSSLYKARMLEQSASRRGAITILERPVLGMRVSGVVPKTFQKRLSIALGVSMVLGLIAAFAMEYLQKNMRVTTSIEEVLELRVLGTVPKLPREVVMEWREAKTQLTRGNGRTNVPSAK